MSSTGTLVANKCLFEKYFPDDFTAHTFELTLHDYHQGGQQVTGAGSLQTISIYFTRSLTICAVSKSLIDIISKQEWSMNNSS